MPPSYEECVFGRMESQELEPGEVGVEDDDDHTRGGTAAGTSNTASRRPRLHRLPSYPYYSFESPSPSTSTTPAPPSSVRPDHSYPDAPPPLPSGENQGYHLLPVSEQPTYTSLPPPPSYESLGLNH
ncbi:hypothetical protein EGW08_016419 [Elysia chlorotica]|uniref:Uncharacterized protein n=1 Tax=Elysia chlorotica TaxID=188477 RepID=A0A433T2P7_ELYCH|nr:hypothetical protein EGW08_016419 [Elysia chlorotica]